MGREVVAAVVPIGVLWADTEEIADWWMMTNLLAVDLSAIVVVAL